MDNALNSAWQGGPIPDGYRLSYDENMHQILVPVAPPQAPPSTDMASFLQNHPSVLAVANALQDGYQTPWPFKPFAGLYRGGQEALVQAGVPKDVVSLGDAFAGSPGHFTSPAIRNAAAEPPPAFVPPTLPQGVLRQDFDSALYHYGDLDPMAHVRYNYDPAANHVTVIQQHNGDLGSGVGGQMLADALSAGGITTPGSFRVKNVIEPSTLASLQRGGDPASTRLGRLYRTAATILGGQARDIQATTDAAGRTDLTGNFGLTNQLNSPQP